MAKGLRASSKASARAAKRQNAKSDYAVASAARLNAVAARLADRTVKGKKLSELEEEEEEQAQGKGKGARGDSQEDQEEMSADEAAGADEIHDGSMDVDSSTKQQSGEKVSTSGTRESRRETWRKAKGWKVKRGQNATHGSRSKNGGRPARRR